MVEETTKPSSFQEGRPRNNANKRQPRKRPKRSNKKRSGGGGRPQIQPEQIKVTFRNIGDVDRCGTVRQVLDMIRTMTANANDCSTGATRIPIRLDEASLERLIRAEAMANAESEAAKQDVANSKDKDGEEKKSQETGVTIENKPTAAQVVQGMDSSASCDGSFVTARALYVVPPKKSRRRGERGGCAYFILTAPLVPLPKPVGDEPPKQLTPQERSRITAIGRLQLTHAVESLSSHANDDAKAKQVYAGCKVAASISGKTWKDKDFHRDRREGTIESTSDFKQFMAKQAKDLEERQSRPKPAPGGGVLSSALDDESNQKVSAIVLHLRAKREEQAMRKKEKQAKKKGNKEAKKDRKQNSQNATSGGGGSTPKEGKARGGKGGGRKPRKDGKRKKAGSGGGGRGNGGSGGSSSRSKVSTTPMLLAKPSTNGIVRPG